MPALQALQKAGKTRCIGITGIGDARALRTVVESGTIHSAQVPFNLLNPSADAPLPSGSTAHDFGQVMRHAGPPASASSASACLPPARPLRSPNATPTRRRTSPPIASGATPAADVATAQRFLPLVAEGHVASLVEAALRFVIASDALSTVLIGIATLDQFETAAQAVLKGPLDPTALARVAELQRA